MNSRVKAIKNQGNNWKFLQWGLFLLVVSLIFYQLYQQPRLSLDSIHLVRFPALVIAVLLCPLNWFIEWMKWKASLKKIGMYETFTAKQSFLAGMVSAFLTPSALGNFVGRMASFSRTENERIVPVTLLANAAQFLVSISFGIMGYILTSDQYLTILSIELKMALTLLSIVLVLLYVFSPKLPFFTKLQARINTESWSPAFKWKLFVLSALRYLVFTLQFFLVLSAFHAEIGVNHLLMLSVLYLFTTLSPSLFLGKVFIRESLAIFLFVKFGLPVEVALLSCFLVWFMNNVLPTLGAFYLFRHAEHLDS